MKELAGRIHQLKGELGGQAIAVVEVRVDGKIRYAAATNSGAGWGAAQKKALEKIGIERIEPFGGELVHAEANVEAWVGGLKKTADKVEVLRWGISAGEEGAYICAPCRRIAARLGGVIEEFSALGKNY